MYSRSSDLTLDYFANYYTLSPGNERRNRALSTRYKHTLRRWLGEAGGAGIVNKGLWRQNP